jgi:peptide/nickel transport system substrate-binding protein
MKLRHAWVILGIVVLLLGLGMTSAQDTAETSIPTFREGIVGQVQRINPIFADLNPVDRDISQLIFNGLTRINEYGEAVPDLAQSWVTSRDGIAYVVQLREDVLWQDGTPFTADDVVFTMGLLAEIDFGAQIDLGTFWRTVEVQKLGDYLVRFRLAQPLASFPTKLSIGILPEHALMGTSAEQLAQHPFNLSPIGTGAYQLEALRSRDGQRVDVVDLRLAPTYQQRSNTVFAFSRFRFQLYSTFDDALTAFESGDIDGLSSEAINERGALLDLANTNVYSTINQRVGLLIFNWDEGDEGRFFSEQRVRVALRMGLNTQVPVESQLANRAIAADSPIPSNSWAYANNLPIPAGDSAQALQMLQETRFRFTAPTNNTSPEATAEASENLSDVSFSILVPDDALLSNLVQEFATQWSVLGMQVGVENVAPSAYEQRLNDGDFQVALVEYHLDADPDLYPYWHGGQYPDGLNFGGVSDDVLSELLERARRDANGINRLQLYREVQERFVERAVAIPLYYPLFTYVVRNDIAGIQLGFIGNASDRFRTIADWRPR